MQTKYQVTKKVCFVFVHENTGVVQVLHDWCHRKCAWSFTGSANALLHSREACGTLVCSLFVATKLYPQWVSFERVYFASSNMEKKENTAEAAWNICTAAGDGAVSERMAQRWFIKFIDEDKSVDHAPCEEDIAVIDEDELRVRSEANACREVRHKCILRPDKRSQRCSEPKATWAA